MGTSCSKEEWTFGTANINRIHHAEKPFTHSVVKLLIGKKIVKRRPVISTPKPANPVHLHGRKWRNVIITSIPQIEEPPVRPMRRKKQKRKSNVDSNFIEGCSSGSREIQPKPQSPLNTRRSSYMETLNALTSLQLRRYLCLAKTAIFVTRESNSSRTYRHDLYSIFPRGSANESPTMSKTNAVSPILRNASLTNEPSDTYFQRHDDANTNGFKNFSLLTVERDLDKLKFWKMCRPLQLLQGTLPSPSFAINDVNESGSATRFLDELTHRAEEAANNTKSNQNRNIVMCRKSNIKKVWKRMKNNGRKFVSTKANWKSYSGSSP